jgi:hypothetical protein
MLRWNGTNLRHRVRRGGHGGYDRVILPAGVDSINLNFSRKMIMVLQLFNYLQKVWICWHKRPFSPFCEFLINPDKVGS